MGNFIDLTNKKFGRLTVIEKDCIKNKKIYWLCQCECGKTKTIRGSQLTCGITKSCGCLNAELSAQRATKHGIPRDRFYRIWSDMKTRCTNSNYTQYELYGGRGIKICDEFKDFKTFYNLMRKSYDDHVLKYGEQNTTLDRINVDKDYSFDNCRWATIKEQGNNTRVNVRVSIDGITHTIGEWADISGIKYHTLYARVKRGWQGIELLKA